MLPLGILTQRTKAGCGIENTAGPLYQELFPPVPGPALPDVASQLLEESEWNQHTLINFLRIRTGGAVKAYWMECVFKSGRGHNKITRESYRTLPLF